jgi:hypothetical protein
MEGKLAEKSGNDFGQILVVESDEVRNVFRTKASKFDGTSLLLRRVCPVLT